MDGVGNDLVILDKSDWGTAGGNPATRAPNPKFGYEEGKIQNTRLLWTATFKTHGNWKTQK